MRKHNSIKNFVYATIFLGTFFLPAILFASSLKEGKKIEKAEQSPSTPQELIVRPRVEYKAGDLKDPFQGYKSASGKAMAEKAIVLPKLEISGIVWGSDIPQAIINGRVVKIGDVIENAHIVDINKNGIDIFFEGRQFNLKAPAYSHLEQFKQKREGDEP